MTLVIDLVRALREPEYRDEVSEELESDITDHVRLEAADEIERLRSLNAELVEALEYVRGDLASFFGTGEDYSVSIKTIDAALSRARAKEDT